MTLLEQKAALLAEKMELRMERLAQCEVAFSDEIINDVRRLNWAC